MQMKNLDTPNVWELTSLQAGDTLEFDTQKHTVRAHRKGRILHWDNGEDRIAPGLLTWMEFVSWLSVLCAALNLNRRLLRSNPNRPHIHSCLLTARDPESPPRDKRH